MSDRGAPQHASGGHSAKRTFIVHGHRLSSLYRAAKRTPKPFIVLKILKNTAHQHIIKMSIFRTMKSGTPR
jgi:hypothetical protein